MGKTIISLGTGDFPSDEDNEQIQCVDFSTHISLADADIILISPTLNAYQYEEEYLHQGKQCLSEDGSGNFLEDLHFWRKEIKKALEASKTIFVILNSPSKFYYKTGEKYFSGTGKNRQTTHKHKLFNSYDILSSVFSNAHFSSGSEIIYNSKESILRILWEDNKKYFHCQASFDIADFSGIPIFFQKKGKAVLGGIRKLNSGAKFICLPALELEHPDFTVFEENTDTGENEECWTEEGQNFTKRFKRALIEIDTAVRGNKKLTPTPEWANNNEFTLQSVVKINKKIQETLIKISTQEEKKKKLIKQVQTEENSKFLLYENGTPLEISVREALKLIGFQATHFDDGESEFDVIFSCKEGKFLGEVEGRDKNAIDVKKLSQLMRNLTEYITKEEVTEPAKGVLFGNGFRLKEPQKRDCQFTKKCKSTASNSNIALVNTTDLFPIVKYLKEISDKDFMKNCREALLKTKSGVVKFPEIPKLK